MEVETKNKYRISKWIFFGLAISVNVFIIVHSCLPGDVSSKWSSFVSNIFEKIINSGKGVNPDHIDVTSLALSYNNGYAYNDIPSYEDDGNTHYLPIGTTKLITANILPIDASDKAVIYEVDNENIAMINQQGIGAAITGIGIGEVTITAYSNDKKEIKDTFSFSVIDLKEPTNFEIPISVLDISVDGGDIIPIDIVEPTLCRKTYDEEVFLPRYYDIRELTYTSKNTDVVEIVDLDGVKNVVKGKSVGQATVTVSNKQGVSKDILVNVSSKVAPTLLPDINDIVAYGNDMDLAREDETIGYQLNVDDAFYQSLSPLNVRVFDDGRVIGYRKNKKEDVSYKIRAFCKYDLSQYKDYDVLLTNPPLSDISINISGATAIEGGYEIEQGKQIPVNISTLPGDNYNVTFTVTSSNTDIITINNEGSTFTMTLNQEGEAYITVTCNEFPEINKTFKIVVTKRGVINNDNRIDFYSFMRKAAGHFTLFLISGIFSTLALYQFFPKKKWWLLSIYSLVGGISLACLSELIQLMVPGRNGAFIDIATDTFAYLIPVLIISVIYLIIEIHRKKKEDKNHD